MKKNGKWFLRSLSNDTYVDLVRATVATLFKDPKGNERPRITKVIDKDPFYYSV
ncbi:hypothetical protein [Maribacter sp. 2-571]|uniref:hypothetical protein n=1 Tax=Maribacter sp. 2-571 TaxID=3417569 RepID=UPI003D32A4FB